ncbi:MAG: hypothetical protein EBY16_04080 [Gammaproteobacteria bacterium]|nr:hypothetical protein [Gammaproteobacteria bacterium]
MLKKRHELLLVKKKLQNSEVSSASVPTVLKEYDENYVAQLFATPDLAEENTDALSVKINRIMMCPDFENKKYLLALSRIHNNNDISPKLKIFYIKDLKSIMLTELTDSILARIANFFNPQELDPALAMMNEVLHHYEVMKQEEQIKRKDIQWLRQQYLGLESELQEQLKRTDGKILEEEADTTELLSRRLSKISNHSQRTDESLKIKGEGTPAISSINPVNSIKDANPEHILAFSYPDSLIKMNIIDKIHQKPKKIELSAISQACKSRSGIEYDIINSSGIISTTLSGSAVTQSSDMTLLLTIIDMIDNIRSKHQIIVLDTLNEKAITFANDYVAYLKQRKETISLEINGQKTEHNGFYSISFKELESHVMRTEDKHLHGEGEGEDEGEGKHRILNSHH